MLIDRVRSGRVLIVDDNDYIVATLKKILTLDGFQDVRSVTDPRKVVALQAETHFDLILLDLQMPQMDGIEVLKSLEILQPGAYLPVIMLTGDTDNAKRLEALRIGAKDFLNKPVSGAELLCRAKNIITTHLLLKDQRIEAQRLEQAVRARTRDLERSRMDIIRSLARAGEYRDNETGQHVLRMSRYCHVLARRAGLDEETCDLILHASPMHDVGKIGIPDSILLKQGKLDVDEFNIMKTHTTIGASIIADDDTPLLVMARSVAITHHEKWNGSGYPNGLIGPAIPMEGRIAAICDVFDALTSRRPYKEPWPVETAVAFLAEKSSHDFDPELIGHFMAILPEILEIKDSHGDEG
jgi:putative two-component system response regulator